MKRLCLVLFVCLSVQLSAASAPFLHLHARATPGDEHHDAQVVHRHASSHTAGDHHHDHDDDASADETQHDSTSIAASNITAAITISGLTAKLPRTAASLAPPVTAPQHVATPAPALPPDADVGDSLPDSPDPRSSSHRGPPR